MFAYSSASAILPMATGYADRVECVCESPSLQVRAPPKLMPFVMAQLQSLFDDPSIPAHPAFFCASCGDAVCEKSGHFECLLCMRSLDLCPKCTQSVPI